MTAKRKSKLNLRPAAGYLLIEPAEPERKTASGIYLPETSEEKPQQGRILAVGPDEITEKGTKKTSPVKVGDVVIYKKWGGNEVKIEGKEYLFAKFEDILAIVK
jgi:chaperonin GroES